MNIETSKAYLETVHMNRKIAKYLINTIDDLKEVSSHIPSKSSFKGLFKSSQQLGYIKAMKDIKRILDKEV